MALADELAASARAPLERENAQHSEEQPDQEQGCDLWPQELEACVHGNLRAQVKADVQPRSHALSAARRKPE